MSIENLLKIAPIPTGAEIKEYKLVPASTTSVETLHTCPLMFDGKYIGLNVPKIKFEQNEAALYGDQVHKAIENNLKHDVPIPAKFIKDLPNLEKKVQHVRHHKKYDPDHVAEIQLAINGEGDTAWRGRAMGVFADVLFWLDDHTMLYIDWKTNNTKNWRGKAKKADPKPFQLELTAIILFKMYPQLKRFVGDLEFLRHDQRFLYVFDRDNDYYEQVIGNKRVKQSYLYPVRMVEYWALQKDRAYFPRTSGLCAGWCGVTSCQHWTPRKTP